VSVGVFDDVWYKFNSLKFFNIVGDGGCGKSKFKVILLLVLVLLLLISLELMYRVGRDMGNVVSNS
jgi:hypothetical protein